MTSDAVALSVFLYSGDCMKGHNVVLLVNLSALAL